MLAARLPGNSTYDSSRARADRGLPYPHKLPTPKLADRDQGRTVERPREAVSEERYAYDPMSMAEHIGRLQWHVGELIAVVEQLTGATDPAK